MIDDILVADMRSADSQEALKKAVALLEARGWTIEDWELPDRVSVRSDRWKDTRLSLIRLSSYQVDELAEPDLAKTVESLRTRPATEGFLVLDLEPTDAP